ncbi:MULTISPECIES: cache domain-containing protein [unclassified Neptuniibacter]|uniref:cache domain-containing protein n=1 Tax=unclassified Neptuniibacter TaxID=2630693 RepID=UPI0025D8A817|nr:MULTISPECIES: cache domain-containing protein [unclassified Neptuniibacter]|tara:strand:+ start:5929 stop:7284 length:1356 start_codon:yes stop_codon:yes gene_type:complete
MKRVNASLKAKILLLSILPLILVTVAITMISLSQARILSEQEINTFEENLLNSKHQELQHYVALAMNSIAYIVDKAEPGDKEAEAEVKRILQGLTYGDDGYFFLYDREGTNLVHPIQPELVGQNLIDLQDTNGKYVIRDLIDLAEKGGGFYRYLWRKPSKGDLEEKLSFVVNVPKFNWMMGTGLYIDDIAKEVADIRLKVTRNIRNTFFTVVVILSGTVIVIALVGVAINMHASQLADERLRELAHRYVQFQVSQRRNFARELHDGINQLMVSVKFRLELARDKLVKKDDSAVNDINKGCDVLNMAIQEVRRISHDLRPIQLDDLGLESALHSMTNDFSERTSIEMNVLLELPEQRLPDDIEISLYRIAQEALMNIEKHAEAGHVGLTIWSREGYIWIEVSDDGKGFTPDKDDSGIGLLNMRERTELLSGRFSLKSRVGSGTRLKAGFAIL